MKRYLITFIIIILVISFTYILEKNITQKLDEKFDDNMNNFTNEIRKEIISNREYLETIVKFPHFKNYDLTGMEEILTTVIQKKREFKALYVIDKNGGQSANITQFPDIYLDRSSNIWFSDIIKGTHSGFMSEVNFVGPESSPSITIAVLMRDDNFRINGLVAGELDLGYIFQHRIKKNNYNWLSRVFVTSDNLRILHDSFEENFRSLRLDFEVLDVISRKQNLFVKIKELSEVRVYNLPSWSVIYLIDKSQSFSEIYLLRILALSIIIIALINVFFLVRKK